MSKAGYFERCLFIVLITGVATIAVWPQKSDGKKPGDDPTAKPLNVKSEPNDILKTWVTNGAPYIATKEERDAYLKLKTDDERENFIESFWRRRDPDPDTEANEYREAYYERIAYANEHFASGLPGWRTDRGRIYITWGKPDSIDSHPSGGAYDRPSYEGGGSTTTYPFETWFYRHLDNVGDGIEVEFVDPTGSGEYRIARDANEKDALKTIPGAGLTTSEQLGLSNKGDRIAGIDNGQNYQREQDTMFSRMAMINDLSIPPTVKFSDLQSIAGSDTGVLDNNPLKFDLRVDFFRLSDDRVITAFTVQANNKELKFEPVGSLETATMNIFGRVTAVSGQHSGIFEDSVTTNATSQELVEARDRKSVYQKAIALTPGTYKVGVVVRDVGTGNKGVVNMGFVVPRYDDKKLSTSSLVLTSKLKAITERDIGQPFVIGDAKVIPNLYGVYRRGQEVGVYMQVYNAQIDQTTLRPSVDVTYILLKDGKEMFRQPEDWSGLSSSGQRLTLARLLPTTLLTTGDYELKVQIKDRVDGQLIESKGKFTITQ